MGGGREEKVEIKKLRVSMQFFVQWGNGEEGRTQEIKREKEIEQR